MVSPLSKESTVGILDATVFREIDFHIYSHAKKLHKSLANFNVYFLDIHRNLTIVRKRKKLL